MRIQDAGIVERLSRQATSSDVHREARHSRRHARSPASCREFVPYRRNLLVGAARALAVDGEERDRHVVRLSNIGEVGGQVDQIGADEVENADRLAGSIRVPPAEV